MAKKYGGFNLSKLRFYVEHGPRFPSCTLYVYIPEFDALGRPVHYRQVRYNASASFISRMSKEADFWQRDEYDANVRAWCVKQATKLDLFNKLRKAVYERNGREDPKQ